MLCTLTHDVIGTVQTATQPSCLVESPDGKYLYIADYDGTVTVAPVGSTMTSIEGVAHEAEWAMPELLQYEAALRLTPVWVKHASRGNPYPIVGCGDSIRPTEHEAVLRRDS